MNQPVDFTQIGVLEPKKDPERKFFPYGAGVFELNAVGVYYVEHDNEGKETQRSWICSRLDVVSDTRDNTNSDWGRVLRWYDPDNHQHSWAVPLELLQGDGSDVRKELAKQGLKISPNRKARDMLAAYIQVADVESRARCVSRLGWHGEHYVLPDRVIGDDSETVVFQNAYPTEPAFSQSGSLESWRDNVASLARGNSRVTFAICVGFASPLANIVGVDSGGFHLIGSSSTGKSTSLDSASSIWGEPESYRCTWRATSNGLEGIAAIHNDGLLILDELSQCDPKEVGESCYLLGNGQGKQRANRNGGTRKVSRWRLFYLSAGEESIRAIAKRVGKQTNAGQEIRLAEIEADAGEGMGAFEDIHDHPNPAAFALALKDSTHNHYGHVGIEWLTNITRDRKALAEVIHDGIRQFTDACCPTGTNGQIVRVARRFALVAAAGELATQYGLTGWRPDEANNAVRKCFDSWLQSFGSDGSKEQREILRQVKAFFESHGSSRFEDLNAEHPQKIINRAGFVRDTKEKEREFLVLTEAFKTEICQGFNVKLVEQTLIDAGWLIRGTDRIQQKPNIPNVGRVRVYVICSRIWEGEE